MNRWQRWNILRLGLGVGFALGLAFSPHLSENWRIGAMMAGVMLALVGENQ